MGMGAQGSWAGLIGLVWAFGFLGLLVTRNIPAGLDRAAVPAGAFWGGAQGAIELVDGAFRAAGRGCSMSAS